MVIDFHTHVLPEIDDGSRSEDMSKRMLSESMGAGIDLCVATPHFYAERKSLSGFLSLRDRAYSALAPALEKGSFPRIVLGAEVAFFRGISESDSIGELCIQGTDCLLLEMPYSPWSADVMREVERLSERFHPVFAHIERFFDFEDNVPRIQWLQELDADFQINAESFRKRARRSMIQRYITHDFVLGSDMHDYERRPQNLNAARSLLPPAVLARSDALAAALLGIDD